MLVIIENFLFANFLADVFNMFGMNQSSPNNDRHIAQRIVETIV